MRMQLGDAIKGGMQYSSSERLFAKSLRCSLFAFINHHVLGQGYVLHHRERRALTCAQGRAPPGGEGKGTREARYAYFFMVPLLVGRQLELMHCFRV